LGIKVVHAAKSIPAGIMQHASEYGYAYAKSNRQGVKKNPRTDVRHESNEKQGISFWVEVKELLAMSHELRAIGVLLGRGAAL
jgi:hypothetical protein